MHHLCVQDTLPYICQILWHTEEGCCVCREQAEGGLPRAPHAECVASYAETLLPRCVLGASLRSCLEGGIWVWTQSEGGFGCVLQGQGPAGLARCEQAGLDLGTVLGEQKVDDGVWGVLLRLCASLMHVAGGARWLRQASQASRMAFMRTPASAGRPQAPYV